MRTRKIFIAALLFIAIMEGVFADPFTLASWNVRILSDNSRDDGELSEIAQIIERYDIVAIQEARDTEVLDRLVTMLGPDWEYIASQPSGRGVKEIYAFVYDRREIENISPVSLIDDRYDLFIREPAVAAFKSDNFDFVLVSIHVIYGDRIADRRDEISLLDEVLAMVDQQFEGEDDIILLGDFNMDAEDESWQMAGFTPIIDEDMKTTITDTSSYDNIWLPTDHTYFSDFERFHEMYAFDEIMHADADDTASRRISDHRPISVVFSDAYDDDTGYITLADSRTYTFAPAGYSSGEPVEVFVEPDHVYISDVITSPTDEETIYILNPTGETVNLDGWILGDLNDPRSMRLENIRLEPSQTLVVSHSMMNFQINNRGEELFLHNRFGELIHHWED
jgi:endonuclease/exonuclease/phosphatase family metal-dependent hydrolase